jgi:cytochrome P450/NADPH-cytochrome P450 reductase
LHAAQDEVDRVIGDSLLELKHLAQLTYIDACIKETLRLTSPISANNLHAKEDTRIAGKYSIKKEDNIVFNLRGLHRDPTVWGEDAEEFRPERMLDGGFENLPPNSWKPFGTGMRACIGRTFAEQEMIMNLALVLQRFQLEMVDPSYDLKLKSTLTIKPEGFKIKVQRRKGKSEMVGLGGTSRSEPEVSKPTPQQTESSDKELQQISVFYGSNAGTCLSLAEDLQSKASNYGLSVKVESLDTATENLPTGRPLVLITSSYEGQPPDNAKKFVTWLETVKDDKLKDIKYTVFGVGNSDWARTFHRVPRLVNGKMADAGAESILEAGFADVKGDLTGVWDDWSEKLWESLRHATGTKGDTKSQELSVNIQHSSVPTILAGEPVSQGLVTENRQLAGTEVGSAKHHIEVQLPPGTTYSSGDYLVVLPFNPPAAVSRVLKKFKLNADDLIKISNTSKSFLPSEPQSVFDLLESSVELNTPASQRQIDILANTTQNAEEKKRIESLRESDSYKDILTKRYSLLDILEDHPSCELSFAKYLDMQKPLTPRQYSISSSPLHTSSKALETETGPIVSITIDVLESAAWSGHGQFKGVASTYLASRKPGDNINCFVRSTNTAFHLPKDPEKPVILIAAGSGMAPMRGFIQERAAIAEAGVKNLGPAIFYYGCRDLEKDYIYKDELAEWEKKGIIKVRPTFSQSTEPDGHKYVYHRIWDDREEIASLFANDGKIFVCGSASKLARSTEDVCKRIYKERNGCAEEEAQNWLSAQREVRYVSDVFS